MSALQEIKKIINKPNPRTFFLKVRDANTGQIIDTVSRKDLHERDGLDNYLKWLHQTKGATEVVIDPRRSNGTRDVRIADEAQLKIGNPTNKPMTEEAPTSNPVAHHATPIQPQIPGLMGVGLNQYMDAYSAQRALAKLEQDYSELKLKYEALLLEREKFKDDCAELKREKERLEDRLDRKGPLDGIDVNTVLPALMGLLKPQGSAGLNAPQKQLSPVKEAVNQAIEVFPEEIVEKIYTILENYTNQNEKFVSEFEALINQTNLKTVKDG